MVGRDLEDLDPGDQTGRDHRGNQVPRQLEVGENLAGGAGETAVAADQTEGTMSL